MSEFADKLIADLKSRARDAFSEFGAVVSDDLRKNLSVPVGFRIGPDGGSTEIRSKAGEDPRKEHGDYVSSIDNRTDAVGNRVVTEIFTDMTRGAWLEKGTSRMAHRPHFAPIFQEYAQSAATFIGSRMFKTK